MQKPLLAIFCCLVFFASLAQDPARLFKFNTRINEAKNDGERIIALGQLAEYYSVFKLDAKADSVLQRAIAIAEVSDDKELVLDVLFKNNVINPYFWTSKQTFERSDRFIKKALAIAQDLKRPDQVAMAHIKLAGNYRKRGLYTEAIEEVTEAFTALGDTDADSLRCIIHIELGDIYVAKGDAIPGYKNYNQAFDISYRQHKNVQLQSVIYRRFSEIYRSFGDSTACKNYLLQSLQINTENKKDEGLYRDYIDLARITDQRDYIDKAAALANKLDSDRFKLSAKRLMFYWHMVKGKNSDSTLGYLFSNLDLLQYFSNSGPATLHWQMGNAYRYATRYDSALHYYKLAESVLASNYDKNIQNSISTALAETYQLNGDSANARKYFETAFSLNKEMNNVTELPSICQQLGALHAANGDFAKAYRYSVLADSTDKVLQENAARDKMVLLQVERENKKRESDLAEATRKKARIYNLQIMAITLVIAAVFAFMLFIGMFAVSKTTIRMLGYFAFICLFEFIVLVLDHEIHAFTHGQPLKIWIIKIFLIAMLVPLQQFLEHRLIKFLESRKLLEARQRFSLKNWWYRLRKKFQVNEETKDKESDQDPVVS